METIELKIYDFDELSEAAKRKALDNFKPHTDFIWYDAEKTVEAFCKAFNVKTGRNSWLEYDLGHWDGNILELKGLRLRTWIINNWGHKLYKRKFYNSIGNNKVINHPCIKTNYYDMSKGARVNSSNFYYSRINFDTSCVLTGMCYDDMLEPIYKFLAYIDAKNMQHVDINDLISDCFYNMRETIDMDIKYRNSDEGKEEEIEANGYRFLEDGELWSK